MTTADVRSDPRLPRRGWPVGAPLMRALAMPSGPARRPSIDRPAPPPAVPAASVETALGRILASDTFRHSERHRSFLRYVVEATLAGRARSLKEVVIGLDVFDRDLDGYDPRRDSIVRVEARRLRKKLGQYYDGEGKRDAIEIRMDAGSYVPRFVAQTGRRSPRAARTLVIIVPFAVVGSGDAASILAIGLADQLVDCIGAIDGLDVMAPMVASRLLDDAIAVDTLHRAHGVDFIVDGSVTQVGSQLRCALHLSSTEDGVRRWSQLFDCDRADGLALDLFAFQDRIAAAACDALARARHEAA